MFKNVIVGIDFSECSYNAMLHAISLAGKLNTTLTLLFVVTPDEKIMVDSVEKESSDIITYAQTRLSELVEECKKSLPNQEVKYKIRMGKPSREINTEAKIQGDAITVLGTHGCSGFEEFFIGSSAFKTVSGSYNPIMTIREGINIHRDLTDILLAIDDTRETLQKLKVAARLAKAFQAKIHIMGAYVQKYPEICQIVDANVTFAENFLTEKDIRYETSKIENDRKVESVIEEARKRDVNLIIVMKEVELAGETQFILAPFSERIVNRSPIPILTIPVDTSIYYSKDI